MPPERPAVCYARLVDQWGTAIGLRPQDYSTHSRCGTKAAIIYKATGNLRAVQVLLDHTKIENTVRYLGVDIKHAWKWRNKRGFARGRPWQCWAVNHRQISNPATRQRAPKSVTRDQRCISQKLPLVQTEQCPDKAGNGPSRQVSKLAVRRKLPTYSELSHGPSVLRSLAQFATSG